MEGISLYLLINCEVESITLCRGKNVKDCGKDLVTQWGLITRVPGLAAVGWGHKSVYSLDFQQNHPGPPETELDPGNLRR